ncbi:unnamed protein product [Paramecium primaurelia]|uniref:Uncharacterized protein n=1 Tax=Paramecium primaurelia TaxID=5886 RepID=A0A8S1NI25_PARPR|nr:unnamed protein product [Paramecium primaurelia]
MRLYQQKSKQQKIQKRLVTVIYSFLHNLSLGDCGNKLIQQIIQTVLFENMSDKIVSQINSIQYQLIQQQIILILLSKVAFFEDAFKYVRQVNQKYRI